MAICSKGSYPFFADITGMDFAVNMGLTHAAGNELGDLGTEVKNEYFVV
jgi:hypothetical protein